MLSEQQINQLKKNNDFNLTILNEVIYSCAAVIASMQNPWENANSRNI